MASAPTGTFVSPPVEGELRAREVASSHRLGFWRRMITDRSALAGLVIVGVLVAAALVGPLVVPYDPLTIDPLHALEAPSLAHPMGTDHLGRDTLSRVIAGARISVSIALFTGVAILTIGVVVGSVAGYVGRWVDSVIMRVVDVLLAFPTLILSLAIAGALGSGYATLITALVVTWWPAYARLTRGSVLAEREREYVEALRGLGARSRRIVVRHILPNALPPVLVLLSFDLGGIILAIAALGYLGVGIAPPSPEWGTMVSDARIYVFASPWVIVFPGLAIAVTVVGFNLLGEGLREALDPQLSSARRSRWWRRTRALPRAERRRSHRVVTPAAGPAAAAGTVPAAAAGHDGGELMRVEGLTTRLQRGDADVHAVEGVSLSVRAGETVGLVGESGCGKTMTGLSIMRLLPRGGRVVSGAVMYGGRDLTAVSEAAMREVRGREIAMVFQDPMSSLNPTMTIGAQIADPVHYHLGLSRRAALDRAAEVLSLVGMPRPAERLSDFPHQLSGGLRQRAMIAMALACEPKLLIADEPTTALDVTIQAQILALLADLQSKLGMGMILITHDMGVIAGMADRVLVMYAGRIVESAPTTTLFHSRRHPYTKALLDSIPQVDQDSSRRLYSIPGLPPDLAGEHSGCRFAPRCRSASDRCQLEEPALAGDDDVHSFACFHPVTELAEAAPTPSEGALATAVPGEPVTVSDPGDGTLLTVEGLVKEYAVGPGLLARRKASVKAVSRVSFAVEKGEAFGLVGESGCGKTTIARMIVALERPDAGRVLIDGVDIGAMPREDLRRRRGDVQLMFQSAYAAMDPRIRVGEALEEPMVIQGVGTQRERIARVDELLHEVGLDVGTADLYPHQLSGGQRQRVGFARALVLNPRLVVADEPVSALDVSIRAQILNLMKRLQQDHDLTLVVISHDLSVIRYLATRVGVMHLGKLVEVGPTERIYDRPAHPYTAGLLAAIPIADPVRARAQPPPTVLGELPSAITPPTGCRFRTRCPLARELCAKEEPPMRLFGPRGHEAACHFPLQPAV